MAQIRPKILLRYGRINEPVQVPLVDMTVDAPKTTITQNLASDTNTIPVKNTTGFENAYPGVTTFYLLIGEPQNGGTELIQVTSISQTSIELDSPTVYPHSFGTTVRLLQFNEVELSHATTTNGVKSVLATIVLAPNLDATEYNDLDSEDGYYFARFRNSVDEGDDNEFSPYSDPAPYEGYTILSARSIIDKALNEINKKTSEVLSDEYAFQQLDAYQSEVLREQKRWAFMQEFNANIGTARTGTWRFAVPEDLDDQFTNKTTWHLRVGKNPNLTFVDKTKWDQLTNFVAWTTLAENLEDTDTEVVLTDSSDFDDGGVIQIGDQQLTYTENDRDAGTLTLESAYDGDTIDAGTDVFSGAALGLPMYWTIFGGYFWVWPVIAETYNGRTVYADYYKKQTRIQRDSDILVVPDETGAMYYLEWKFLRKLKNGEETPESTAARDLYLARREKVKQKDSIGRTFRLKPLKNNLQMRQFPGNDPQWIRDGNFPDI